MPWPHVRCVNTGVRCPGSPEQKAPADLWTWGPGGGEEDEGVESTGYWVRVRTVSSGPPSHKGVLERHLRQRQRPQAETQGTQDPHRPLGGHGTQAAPQVWGQEWGQCPPGALRGNPLGLPVFGPEGSHVGF